jgi:hypothetical protein
VPFKGNLPEIRAFFQPVRDPGKAAMGGCMANDRSSVAAKTGKTSRKS